MQIVMLAKAGIQRKTGTSSTRVDLALLVLDSGFRRNDKDAF
jgi:hypothetical protein